MSEHRPTVIESVRRALGRAGTLSAPPTPPMISEPVARLVHSDIGLSELFAKRATEMNMNVSFVSPADVAGDVLRFVREHDIKKIALPVSPLLQRLNIPSTLLDGNLFVRTWDEMTLDELYDGYD